MRPAPDLISQISITTKFVYLSYREQDLGEVRAFAGYLTRTTTSLGEVCASADCLMALVGPHRRLATAARVDNSPPLTTSTLVGSIRQLTAATASALVVNGSGHRCQHIWRLSPSVCNGPGRSFSLHGWVATPLPYVRYRDMPLMAQSLRLMSHLFYKVHNLALFTPSTSSHAATF